MTTKRSTNPQKQGKAKSQPISQTTPASCKMSGEIEVSIGSLKINGVEVAKNVTMKKKIG